MGHAVYLRCGGSPTFLKHRFGTGYHMKVLKLPRCNVAGIQELLRRYAPKARLESDSDNEAVFILGQIISSRKAATMFMDIEQRSADLGIASVGLAVTSLEDVLLKVGEDQHIHGKTATMANEETPEVDAKMPIVKTIASTTAIEPSLCGRVWAVVLKRATYVWRQKKIPLFSWLLPPLMLSLLFFLEYVSLRGSGQDVEHVGDTVRYTFHELIGHTQGFIIMDEHEHFMETWFMPLIANPEQFYVVKVTKGGGITASLLSVAKETLRKYVFNIHFGVQMTEKDGNALWYNGQIQHLAPLVLNLFNTARLRNVTKDESADFIFEVTSRGVTDAQVAQHSRSGMMIDHASGSSQYRVVLPKVLRSIFFPLVSSLMCSNFVIFPTAERVLGVKQLHLIAGMGTLLYWLTNYAFDFMFYMGTAMIVLLPLQLVPYTMLDIDDYNLIFLLNLLHGYAALPFIYICSFLYSDPASAYSTLVILLFLITSAGCLGSVFMEHYVEDVSGASLVTAIEVALNLLRLLPSFSYSRGMMKIIQLARENDICQNGGLQLEGRCQTKEVKGRLSLMQCCMRECQAVFLLLIRRRARKVGGGGWLEDVRVCLRYIQAIDAYVHHGCSTVLCFPELRFPR
ncbi:hypothetical protein HPB51_024520 [Rhipicephalus microplus]|uniref:ABC-2 type transporter transmembrane domain-containing protein n=1 Tax=Rhipicephalus microplus TaxID=6941 RepID=A0A9J6EDN0_RHIMP|nr:hypothetical protein HPB51_024520 [Rhipicephalus microplus]